MKKLILALLFGSACGGSNVVHETWSPPDSGSDLATHATGACVPLPAIGGSAFPGYAYCSNLGYTLNGSDCVMPDGSTCDVSDFYYGSCGQAFSFCARQGGTTTSVTDATDAGFTERHAVCTLPNGASCDEQVFSTSCECP